MSPFRLLVSPPPLPAERQRPGRERHAAQVRRWTGQGQRTGAFQKKASAGKIAKILRKIWQMPVFLSKSYTRGKGLPHSTIDSIMPYVPAKRGRPARAPEMGDRDEWFRSGAQTAPPAVSERWLRTGARPVQRNRKQLRRPRHPARRRCGGVAHRREKRPRGPVGWIAAAFGFRPARPLGPDMARRCRRRPDHRGGDRLLLHAASRGLGRRRHPLARLGDDARPGRQRLCLARRPVRRRDRPQHGQSASRQRRGGDRRTGASTAIWASARAASRAPSASTLREGRGPLEGHGGSTITQQVAKLMCLGVPYDPEIWDTGNRL